MATLSREAARIIIGSIREGNGGISPEDRAVSPPAVLRALENVRRKLGAATKTLATNLYSKDTRFVYELIQNAEDNAYSRAEAESKDIYLSFSLYPNKIVLESNEDGFEEKHVRAICSTGESTKSATQGYIGEKGIGFKSVFKVAKKVHVQSGPFSFSFEHTRDSSDDGLGMVTPLDEEYEQLPTGVNTRITLLLLDLSTFRTRAQDLLDIPNTLLLFLTKLTTLHINIYPKDENATEIKYIHTSGGFQKRETITKTGRIKGRPIEERQDFFVIRKDVRNLPPHEARKNIHDATVVLAFPIDAKEEPIIEQQYAFAFLPLRLAGFTFLIQSDFVTQASREDVFHSTRNEHLLQSVAETFRDAVLHFCSHKKLQYQWMRYLPSASISDEFWKNLRPRIITLLAKTQCLRSWRGTSLHLPNQVYFLDSEYMDRHDEPLFKDLSSQDKYLSKLYDEDDFLSLSPLGITKMNLSILRDIIRSDLKQSQSVLKDPLTEEDWHTRTARLLLSLYGRRFGFDGTHMLQSLDMIPLQNQKWVSYEVLPGEIYLPTTGKIPVPTDLGLNLVQSAAALNAARKKLFVEIGVKNAPSEKIIALIFARYIYNLKLTVTGSISHLRYFYWNLHQDVTSLKEIIFLYNHNGSPVSRNKKEREHIYFEEENEKFGPRELFPILPMPDAAVPTVHFLNTAYLDAVPEDAQHNGRSWKQWLREFAGVKSYVQLHHPRLDIISNEFKYILERKPLKLPGLLKRYWPFYDKQLTSGMVDIIKRTQVLCEGYSKKPLEETFLPLPSLKAIVDELRIVDFAFLILPEVLTETNADEWLFLERFGATTSDNLKFYIAALSRIEIDNYENESIFIKALFRIYHRIKETCSSEDDVAHVCGIFNEYEYIYIPSETGQYGKWVKSGDCVWSAPKWLESRSRLNGVLGYAKLEHLFRLVLRIPDAGWKLYLEDLKTLKSKNRGASETISKIYHLLWREFEKDSVWENLRKEFEDSELVFLPSQNTWHPPSSCIWADDQVQIPKKQPIKITYAKLEDFFCRMLHVQKPNLDMHVQALKELAANQPPPSASDVKQMIMVISSMEPNSEDVKSLRRSNIFSVIKSNGQKAFTDSTTDFAIVDRPAHASAFSGKIIALDYTIEEVHTCYPLFCSLGLKNKHLSELVEEKTKVKDGKLNHELTHAFRQRAYAIFRCIVHYQNQRRKADDKSIYHQLLKSSIYISNGIYKSISIVQYSETIIVEDSPANFHLEEDLSELGLYVPRDEVAREQCYFQQLPRRLMAHFTVSDPAAAALLSGIISSRFLGSVDCMLKEAGIIEIEGIEPPVEEAQSVHRPNYEAFSARDNIPSTNIHRTSELRSVARRFSVAQEPSAHYGDATVGEDELSTTAYQTSDSRSASPGSPAGQTPFVRYEVDYSGSVPRRSPQPGTQSSVPDSQSPSPVFQFRSPSPFFRNPTPPLMDSAIPDLRHNALLDYIAILERVINSAERLSIPMYGDDSVDDRDIGLHQRDTFFLSALSGRSVERNRKVGAAGELFVYELLCKLELSAFDISNWKSTIRHEVSVHDKYLDLRLWPGRETSDITYNDAEGELTKFLIEKGYLQREDWEDKKPFYYLEVKTSTAECSEQFYMSGSQYNRMQRMRLDPNRAPLHVYVIFRVFNLKGKIGLRVYVDPEAARLRGELNFSIDNWAVKPTDRVQN